MKTNQKIVLFVALEEEIPVGSVKFPVVYMGIGKVNAAVSLMKWLWEHKDEDLSDYLILNAGTAGSATWEIGTILCPDTFDNGGDKMVFDSISLGSSNITCRSSDDFISFGDNATDEQKKLKLSYDCFEMEAYALSRICAEFKLKFSAVKLVSDNLKETVKDWEERIESIRPTLIDFINNL